MPYIPPEVVAKAKEMDLLTYLKNYEPGELVHFGGSTYCTRTHDSLKISNGKWCWFSRGIGGKTALDYLIKVREIPFTEAVEMIVGQAAVQPPTYEPAPKKDAPKVLLLPPASRSATHAVSYLSGRGIDSEVIDFCISTGRMYESSGRYHNVIFVGHDRYGKARYANLRGIGSDFKGECNGSDKRFSFNIPAENSGILHLFESAIDLLSFATIRKLNGMDWRKDHLLSLAGVYQPREKIEESAVPLALSQYLRDHPEIKTIILRLDNDRAGRMAAKALMTVLPKDYTVIVAAITTKTVGKRKLPTHYEIRAEHGLKVPSLVLLEQIRTIDKHRLEQRIGKLSAKQIKELNHALAVSVGLIGPKPKAMTLCLCPTCVENFFSTGAYYLKRIDPYKTEKDTCTYCNQRRGFDYFVGKK